MQTVAQIASWGTIIDAKATGLNSNQGIICPLCGEDAGKSPVRIDFFYVPDSRYFHRDCAAKLENKDTSFFGVLKNVSRV